MHGALWSVPSVVAEEETGPKAGGRPGRAMGLGHGQVWSQGTFGPGGFEQRRRVFRGLPGLLST